MSEIQGFKDLIVWQKSMDLSEQIYRFTKYFPKEEIYGITNQMRRASISIPSNIAEGSGRRTTMQYLHFLGVSKGSAMELETQISIAARIGFIQTEIAENLLGNISEINRMLSGLMLKLESKLPKKVEKSV